MANCCAYLRSPITLFSAWLSRALDRPDRPSDTTEPKIATIMMANTSSIRVNPFSDSIPIFPGPFRQSIPDHSLRFGVVAASHFTLLVGDHLFRNTLDPDNVHTTHSDIGDELPRQG